MKDDNRIRRRQLHAEAQTEVIKHAQMAINTDQERAAASTDSERISRERSIPFFEHQGSASYLFAMNRDDRNFVPCTNIE